MEARAAAGRMLDLYKLDLFSRVAEHGSFSRAAVSLRMSQSAISQHMRELERGLGVALFTRGPRGVVLTETGAILLRDARALVKQAAEAEARVASLAHAARGQLRLGVTPGVGTYLLPAWITPFQAAFPAVSVSVTTDITPGIASQVAAGELGLAIIEGEIEASPHAARLATALMADVPQLVVVGRGHAWWRRKRLILRNLHGQPMVAREPRSQTRIWLNHTLAAQRVRPRVVAELDSPEAIKRAVAAGAGFAVLPAYAVRDEALQGAVRALDVADHPLRRGLKLVWRGDAALGAPARALIQHLAREYPGLAAL